MTSQTTTGPITSNRNQKAMASSNRHARFGGSNGFVGIGLLKSLSLDEPLVRFAFHDERLGGVLDCLDWL
jgi:hypothetical protein